MFLVVYFDANSECGGVVLASLVLVLNLPLLHKQNIALESRYANSDAWLAAIQCSIYQRGMEVRLRAPPNRVRAIDQEEIGLSVSVPLSSAGPGGRAWRR